MIIKFLALIGSTLAQGSVKFWRFTLIKDVSPAWDDNLQNSLGCNYKADGEILVSFCDTGEITVSSNF